MSGKDWRGLSKGEQQAYAVGVVDGFELAYAYGKKDIDLGWINACVTGMSSDQVRAMLGATSGIASQSIRRCTVR
jgi:hypothetical protein